MALDGLDFHCCSLYNADFRGFAVFAHVAECQRVHVAAWHSNSSTAMASNLRFCSIFPWGLCNTPIDWRLEELRAKYTCKTSDWWRTTAPTSWLQTFATWDSSTPWTSSAPRTSSTIRTPSTTHASATTQASLISSAVSTGLIHISICSGRHSNRAEHNHGWQATENHQCDYRISCNP